MHRTRTLLLALLGAVVLFGLYRLTTDRIPSGQTHYRSGTYVLGATPVTLMDSVSVPGTAGADDVTTTRVFGEESFGDVDGDGTSDVVFVLSQSRGGTGQIYYLAVSLESDTTMHVIRPVVLGDRITPQSTDIEDGVISVQYKDRRPGESYSATPSIEVSRHFRIVDGILVEVR